MITIKSNQNVSPQNPVKFIKKAKEPSQFLTSLNEKASKTSTQRAFGRKREVDLISQTLLRRKKANPILIGAPGTGKTAIIEEIAHLIVDGKIHDDLQGVEILELDVNALLAGTSQRGAFEERIVEVLKELEELNENAILFIDEIHQILNTDGTGRNDSRTLGELMKPALVRGNIRCIGATTPDEYSKSFMKNPALNRRFQKIEICQPTASQTFEILKNAAEYFETHHKCTYSISSLKLCVDIADDYVKYRQFPDKALDLLDEIGSMHCIDVSNGSRTAKEIIDCEYVVKFATAHLGFDLSPNILNGRNLGSLNHQAIKMRLNNKIIGQDDTINQISKCFMRKDCGLRDRRRPIASILLHGMSGIGKSALAEAIANEYNYSLLRYDMGEHMDGMSASSLVGSPPGYVGYDEGGTLTNKMRREPRSLVLFDNVDKGHPQVINLLLQIMEDGFLNDSEGNRISFSNAVVILTVTIDEHESGDIGFDVGMDNNEKNVDLSHLFKPEFLNRIDLTIKMRELTSDDLRQIATRYIKAKIESVKAVNSSVDIPSDDDDIQHYVEEILSIDKVRCPRSVQRYVEKILLDPKISEILQKQKQM